MIVPTTELESTSAFTIGSPIDFTFNGAMAHLFDRNTKKIWNGLRNNLRSLPVYSYIFR